MNICLISPHVGFESEIEELRLLWATSEHAKSYRSLWSGVSSALLTIAALTPEGHGVSFIDENVNAVDFDMPYDLVGISIMTQQALRGYELADEFRRRGTPVVIGGIHATLLPEEAALHADAVLVGEAEEIWGTLVADCERGSLRPLYVAPGVADLSRSPCPRFDLLPRNTYSLVNMQTSRGCPHDCDYCSGTRIYGPRVRTKSAAQLDTEIARITDLFPGLPVVFSDDNLLSHSQHADTLLSVLRNHSIRWHGQSDISVADDTIRLRTIAQSGCSYLFIGLESLSTQGLLSIDRTGWKARHAATYAEKVKRIQDHGVGVMGAFIVGLDTDDESVFSRITEFVYSAKLYATTVTILTPFPGTRLRQRILSEGRLLPLTWASYTGYNVTFVPRKMTANALQSGLVSIYRDLFSSESYLRTLSYFKSVYRARLAGPSPAP
jgi:radical SAM superfamily enzyme YgiQ (UPF0313 family)